MKTIELEAATAPLAEYASSVEHEPLIITVKGRPLAALFGLSEADLESVSLATNEQFLALIQRSRERQAAEGGISPDGMRKRLGLTKPRQATRS